MSFTENMAKLRNLLDLESMDRVVDLLPDLFESLQAEIGEGGSGGGSTTPYWQQTPVEIPLGPNDIETTTLLEVSYDNYVYTILPVSQSVDDTNFYFGLPRPDVTPVNPMTRVLIKLGDITVPGESARMFLVGDYSGFAPIFDPSRSFAYRTIELFPTGYVELVWDADYERWLVNETKYTDKPLVYGATNYTTSVGVGGMNYTVIPDMNSMTAIATIVEDYLNPFLDTELTIFLPNGRIGQRLTLKIEDFESIGEGGGSIYVNSNSPIVDNDLIAKTVRLTSGGYASMVLDFIHTNDQSYWRIVSIDYFDVVDAAG